MNVIVLIGTGAALIALVIGLLIRHERKRTEKFEQAASELGLPFHAKGDPGLFERLNAFHLFSQGRSRKMTNLVYGQTEYGEVALFGYRYTIGHGKNSSTHRQNVVYFRSSGLDLPQFALRPENIFHKLGAAMGYQDIDFDAHEAFSKKYLLRGTDEDAIRQTFSDTILSYYETQKGISTEAVGDQLIFYRFSRRIKPEEMMAFLEEGSKILKLFQTP